MLLLSLSLSLSLSLLDNFHFEDRTTYIIQSRHWVLTSVKITLWIRRWWQTIDCDRWYWKCVGDWLTDVPTVADSDAVDSLDDPLPGELFTCHQRVTEQAILIGQPLPLALLLTLWCPLLPYGYSYKASCERLSQAVICNFWHPVTLTLSPEHQSARMSKINYQWRINTISHRKPYGCTRMAIVSIKGLRKPVSAFALADWVPTLSLEKI